LAKKKEMMGLRGVGYGRARDIPARVPKLGGINKQD